MRLPAEELFRDPPPDRALDFTNDRQFLGPMMELQYVERYSSDQPPFYALESATASILPDDGLNEISYDNFTRTFTVRRADQRVSFGPDDLELAAPSGFRFAKSATDTDIGGLFSIFAVKPSFFHALATEHRFSQISRTGEQAQGFLNTERMFLIGVPTVISDMPSSGSSSYAEAAISSSLAYYRANAGFGVSAGSLRIDHGTGVVSGTLDLQQTAWLEGTTPEQWRLTFTGRIDRATNRIDGAITGSAGPEGALSGQFTGRLFGPRGLEVGLLLLLNRQTPSTPDRRIPVVGQLYARLQ